MVYISIINISLAIRQSPYPTRETSEIQGLAFINDVMLQGGRGLLAPNGACQANFSQWIKDLGY